MDAAPVPKRGICLCRGDGSVSKGNTTNDTWQFWFSLQHGPEYHRLDVATATMTPDQRQNGIRDNRALRGK